MRPWLLRTITVWAVPYLWPIRVVAFCCHMPKTTVRTPGSFFSAVAWCVTQAGAIGADRDRIKVVNHDLSVANYDVAVLF